MADADLYAPPAPTEETTGAGDYARAAGAGALNVGSNVAALARYAYEQGQGEHGAEISKSLQNLFGGTADDIREGMSPEAKKLAASTLTSQDFWDHPLLAGTLKATGMLPAMAALAIPGGILADTVAATTAVAAGGGAINAGAGLEDFYKKLDGASDQELQDQSPKYKAMREVMDENTARAKFMRQAEGWAPAVNAVLGAAVGVVGPAGVAARGLASGTSNAVLGAGERGALKSAGLAAAEGAAGNAVQAGVADYTGQQADVDAGFQKEMDAAKTANATLEGAALGGLFGGAVGLVAGGAHAPKAPDVVDGVTKALNVADDVKPVASADVSAPQVQNGTTGVAAKPVESPQVGNPQNEPTRSAREAPKKPNKGAKGAKGTAAPSVEVVSPSGPDSAQLAAVTAHADTPPAPPSPAPTPEAAPTAPAPAPAPAQVAPSPPADATPPGVPPAALEQPGQTRSPLLNQLSGAKAIADQPTVPETPATLNAQARELQNGQRAVIMQPKGSPKPQFDQGKNIPPQINFNGDIYYYDPRKASVSKIIRAAKAGKQNEILGLGPVSKVEAVERANAGETPVAVTERGPDGTELKAAAGTTVTAPAQVAHLEANKAPGSTVAVERPLDVLQMRQQGEPPRTGRILPNLTQTAETVPLSDFNANRVQPPKEPTGKNYGAPKLKEMADIKAKAKAIIDAHPPHEFEAQHMRDPEARDMAIARARSMVEEAEKNGVKIQAQLKKSIRGDALSDDPSIQVLRSAKDLVRTANKRQQGPEITEATGRFLQDEALIKAGYSDEVLAQRREEGDAKLKRRPSASDAELSAAPVEVTPTGTEPAGEAVEATPQAVAKAAQDEITTRSRVSSGDVRGVGDGTEVTDKGVTRAKAANAGRVLSAEEKAAIAERMGLKPAKIKNDAVSAKSEALVVNRNPSEAQKIAGNYKKGHRRVEGFDFTIENPKGAIRRGTEGARSWEVKMPADYGYLRRTRGADGDHVDAYDGKHGDKFFIVDQLDHRTGEFDEHKVMMRFKSEDEAVKAYHAAFSDGRGSERMGHIHEVTPAELKQWLEEGDQNKPHIEHIVGDLDSVNFDAAPGGRFPVEAGNGARVWPLRSSNAAKELDALDMSRLQGVQAPLAKFFQSRLRRLAGEADVHYVTKEDMEKLSPNAPDAIGLHVRNRQTGHSEIYLRHGLPNTMEFGGRGHVLLHELAHAATVREVERVPGAEAMITKLARMASDYFDANLVHTNIEYGASLDYAFTNAKEFIAEAFSNPKFQDFLSRVPIDPDTAAYFGVDRAGHMSAWDVVRKFVQKAVEKITGKLPNAPTVLDGILKVGEHLTKIHEMEHPSPYARDVVGGSARTSAAPRMAQQEALRMMDGAREQVESFLKRPDMQNSERAPLALRWRTFDNIAQIADHFFEKARNPVRVVHEAIEAMRTTADKIMQRSEPLVRRLVNLRAANAEQFSEFSSLLHDATVANVHPDVSLQDVKNAHLGKNAMKGVWSKAQHAELAKRYNALSPDFKETWHDVVKHYTDTQNKMSLGIIRNQVLKLLGIEDDALAKRIHEGVLTDADRAALGSNIDVIERAGELSKIEGPYVPLMRRGDHVVIGDYKVSTPNNASKISENTFQFNTRKEAEDYVKASALPTTLEKVWIDPNTGERLGADELDSVDRYRVAVQNRHVEFVQGRRAAEARAVELAQDRNIDVHKVVPRSLEPNAGRGAELSTALSSLVKRLERSDAYRDASPTQKASLRQAIEEAALASHGSTRISSKALPRRKVAGYSEDLVQNLVDYGASSSRYLSRLEHGTELEAGLKDMKEQLDRDHSKTGQYARTAISNEVRKRIEGDNGYQAGGKFSPIVKRAMSISFIDKLGSPAYSVINAMQPGMVTMPYLSGRHGVGRAFAALGKAYVDINAKNIVGQGIRETGRRLKGTHKPDDFIGDIRSRLSGDEQRMLDEHIKIGTVSPGAGLEIAELVRDTKGVGGKADAALGYLEGVTREMPRAIEAINRTVTALAAYRLERSKGASHDAAVEYSKDAVNNTQFNYSPTNAPPVFNHPLAKIALQFKKYGQGMYQLLGMQIAKAVRNESPGDRKQAVKTLIGIAATHTAIAGALGLPTEPFKYLLMGAHAFGLTGTSWSDVEDKIRMGAANVFGNTGGEVLTRGLPRLFNVDMTRVGLDSVTSFGEPKSDKESDVKTWLFDSLAGPVVSLGGDWIKGLNQISNGNFERAAENLIPLKAASDSLRAYRQATEGKRSASGTQTMTPYTAAETGLRAFGFGSGREAETGAANSAFYRKSTAQKEDRGGLISDWAQATPNAKVKAMAAITKWNQGKPPEVQIKMKDLTAKLKRINKASTEGVHGLVASKRDKRFIEEGSIYNTGG